MSPRRTRRRGRHRAAGRASLLTQFLWLASGRVGGALLQALTLGLLARWVGPVHFGLVAGVAGAAQLSVAVADFGISPSLLRMRSRDPADGRVRELLALNRKVSGLLLVAWAAGLSGAAFLTGDIRFLQLLGVAVWVAAEKNTETGLMVSLADGRTQEMLLSLGLRRILTAGILVAGFVAGLPVLVAYSTGLAVSGLVGAAWTRRRILGTLPPGESQPMRPMLRAALPFWLNSMAIQGRNLDVLLVGLAASPSAAGVYAAPSRLSGPLGLLPSALSQLLLPAAARDSPGSRRQTWLAVLAMTGCVTVLFSGLALIAGDVLPRLLGPGFGAAVLPLRILLIGLIFFGVTASLVSVLQGRGDEWYVASVNLAVVACCLPAVAVAAAIGGAPGAAIAMTVSYAAQAGLLGWRLRPARPALPTMIRTHDRNGEILV
jgi:O-antigen/teichoic acid export membrane protein